MDKTASQQRPIRPYLRRLVEPIFGKSTKCRTFVLTGFKACKDKMLKRDLLKTGTDRETEDLRGVVLVKIEVQGGRYRETADVHLVTDARPEYESPVSVAKSRRRGNEQLEAAGRMEEEAASRQDVGVLGKDGIGYSADTHPASEPRQAIFDIAPQGEVCVRTIIGCAEEERCVESMVVLSMLFVVVAPGIGRSGCRAE